MKNKLTKSDIKLIADKFQLSEKVAKSAIKEFLETPSFANSEEILRICIDADNPKDRKDNVFESLFNTHYDNLVELVCNQIVNTDPCFHILAAFNSTELKNLSGIFKSFNTVDWVSDTEEKWIELSYIISPQWYTLGLSIVNG